MKEKILLLCCVFFATVYTTKAQVTIGAGEAPEKYATLQIKDKTNAGLDSVTSEKGGLLLPRVKLQKKNELLPFASEAEVNINDQAYKDAKLAHIGLIVYNLQANEDEDLEIGINQWDGEQWNSLQKKEESAKFASVYCLDIISRGNYVEGMAATAENYLTMNLNVTRAGTYAISATTSNGYNFYLSGIALGVGPVTVNVPCQGTPVVAQVDTLTITGITLSEGCKPQIAVSAPIAKYSLNCSSIAVNGYYEKGVALNTSNTITLNVTVSAAGSYVINTPLVDGIRFSGSGNLAVGTQTVTLYGSGTPTVILEFPITINANTPEGNNTCSTTIPVLLPEMTYAIIGIGTWSWAANARIDALTRGAASFGPDGIVKTRGLSELWSTITASDAANYLNNGYNGGQQPDIVLYFAYMANPTTELSTALANYINKGGCVIYGSADGTSASVNILLQGVFGINTAQAQVAGSETITDNDYQIANNSNDPIINGPFGDLSGKYWGEDNGSDQSVILTALPANSVQICSAYNPFGKMAVNPEYSIVWYNNSKNFVYFGDSPGAETNNISQNDYPTSYTADGLPQSKLYGNFLQTAAHPAQYVYNAALELNAISWCIKKAAIGGINPH